jgi:S-methylmethionine-dependent homocysteine/selenocysteine methylase
MYSRPLHIALTIPHISELSPKLPAIMSLPPVRYTILDGGMGTTLEDSGHNVSSNLWSSDPALRSAVRDVHAGFLDAGAEMIGTAT